MIAGIKVTPLKIIPLATGDILHAMKKEDPGFDGFGEAYFSLVKPGEIKAWKRHHQMTLNLVVPVGAIKFVLYDDRPDSPSTRSFFSIHLSRSNYHRLTVPPMIWMGFQGVGPEENLLLNIANLPHDPVEADRQDIHFFPYAW
ncbi:MAG: dTDP-4-dehydrorhamnose 3,5-epimerase [SAR324 cluster bacterium]|nr:dTDP-4-dehydrorhamnose 3,5-epimerase [SAR324 cluster bacterium]